MNTIMIGIIRHSVLYYTCNVSDNIDLEFLPSLKYILKFDEVIKQTFNIYSFIKAMMVDLMEREFTSGQWGKKPQSPKGGESSPKQTP